jgi:excisionase family DNA binding protein
MANTVPLTADPVSPWLTVREAAAYCKCGTKLIYTEARAKRIRHAVLFKRRALRFRTEWLDAYIESFMVPVEVPGPRGRA